MSSLQMKWVSARPFSPLLSLLLSSRSSTSLPHLFAVFEPILLVVCHAMMHVETADCITQCSHLLVAHLGAR